MLATGGGYDLTELSMRPLSSHPHMVDDEPIGWTVIAENTAAEAKYVDIWVICAAG
jgi:hypothetical protein